MNDHEDFYLRTLFTRNNAKNELLQLENLQTGLVPLNLNHREVHKKSLNVLAISVVVASIDSSWLCMTTGTEGLWLC